MRRPLQPSLFFLHHVLHVVRCIDDYRRHVADISRALLEYTSALNDRRTTILMRTAFQSVMHWCENMEARLPYAEYFCNEITMYNYELDESQSDDNQTTADSASWLRNYIPVSC